MHDMQTIVIDDFGHAVQKWLNGSVSCLKWSLLGKCKGKGKCIAVCETSPTPLREITYHMGSHSVTCHPAEVTFPPLPQPKLVLDLATPRGCKAELT